MAVKTITIDIDAYGLLAREKREGESFSKVIKRKFRGGRTAEDLLKNLDLVLLEEATLNRMEKIVSKRALSPSRKIKLDGNPS